MIKHKLPPLRQRLEAIHAEMAAVLPTLLGREPLLPAYLRYQPRTCDKKTALPTCEGGRGYQPVVAYWVEQRLIVADQFRDGTQAAP